ncbi:hypothetical protein [Acidilobus sp.]|uniref:hypothetical protein n=1 Tax=Acidilobus sp. TaxID=1872109 RepID=UPI003CFDAAF7
MPWSSLSSARSLRPRASHSLAHCLSLTYLGYRINDMPLANILVATGAAVLAMIFTPASPRDRIGAPLM